MVSSSMVILDLASTKESDFPSMMERPLPFALETIVEATELYSHIEFKDFDLSSMDITEQYVNGRYGAIPRIKVQR